MSSKFVAEPNRPCFRKAVTENLPRRKNSRQIDADKIHKVVDDALSILLDKGSRAEDFDLKVEYALRTIRAELERIKRSRGSEK